MRTQIHLQTFAMHRLTNTALLILATQVHTPLLRTEFLLSKQMVVGKLTSALMRLGPSGISMQQTMIPLNATVAPLH
jgi:hypothetical protein